MSGHLLLPKRWGPTRRAMESMSVGDEILFPRCEKNNVVTNIQRLRIAHADEGRRYTQKCTGKIVKPMGILVTRTK